MDIWLAEWVTWYTTVIQVGGNSLLDKPEMFLAWYFTNHDPNVGVRHQHHEHVKDYPSGWTVAMLIYHVRIFNCWCHMELSFPNLGHIYLKLASKSNTICIFGPFCKKKSLQFSYRLASCYLTIRNHIHQIEFKYQQNASTISWWSSLTCLLLQSLAFIIATCLNFDATLRSIKTKTDLSVTWSC